MMPALGAGGRWFESGRPHLFLSEPYRVFHYFSNIKIFKFLPEEPKIVMNLILYSTLIEISFRIYYKYSVFFNNIILSSYSCFLWIYQNKLSEKYNNHKILDASVVPIISLTKLVSMLFIYYRIYYSFRTA
jgi:hypothetical protein